MSPLEREICNKNMYLNWGFFGSLQYIFLGANVCVIKQW